MIVRGAGVKRVQRCSLLSNPVLKKYRSDPHSHALKAKLMSPGKPFTSGTVPHRIFKT